MTGQQQLRISGVDQESVNALLQNYLDSAIEEEGNEQPFVAPGTKAERDRVWIAWTEFCGLTKKTEGAFDNHSAPQSCAVDPERFWVDFARDPSAPRVQAPVQAFLHTYVVNSVKERVVLGPEERAMVRTLNSAYSVIEVWRRLVASADFKVLRGERRELHKREKHLEANRLFLRWEQEGEKRDGPAYRIVQWILLTLSPTVNLEINTLYVKVEATAADIIVILLALYKRAEDIPTTPLTRVSFHAAVLLASTGGFRPGTLENTSCRQYTLSVVRDPDDRTQRRIIVTPNISRNKIKQSQMTCKYRKQRSVAYSTALVPFPVLCLGSLVMTRALEMGALDTPHKTAHDLINRPHLGGTNRLDIPWKEEYLDKPLFPLTYEQFYDLWTRCLLVIGCRKPIRPYALRVGAGARMDESLSSALRNYVMSHSGDIFETEYQTGVVRANLASLAFGAKTVRRDETLFGDLRNMSLTRDEGAPISVSEERIAKFQERNDIAKFRAEIRASTDGKEKNKLYSQIRSTIQTCTKLQLDEDREAYFKEADRLRLRGIEPEPTPGARGAGRADPVAALLSAPKPQDGGESLPVGTSVSERYIDAQLRYLSSVAPSVPRQVPETTAASKSQPNSVCFVCPRPRGFANRSSLTRHFLDTHLADGTFNGPFACRECERARAAEVFVHDPAQWCNHLEHTHGLTHTPRIKPGVSPRDGASNSPLSCLLCEAPMACTRTLLAHMNRTEIPRFRKGLRVACGACTREGRVGVQPMTIWEWMTHARAVHKWPLPHEPCLLCGHLCALGSGFRQHFTTQHSQRLGDALECAACVASTTPAGEMQGIEELLLHAAERHPSGQAATNATGGKRKRDGDGEHAALAAKRARVAKPKEGGGGHEEHTALAAKPKEGGDDGEHTAQASKRTRAAKHKHKEGGDGGEHTALAAKREKAAKHNEAYMEFSRVAYSDPCEEVIICSPTIDEQQTCENHMRPSAFLDSDFLGHVDPALLASWQPAASAHHTAAALVV